TSTCFKRRAENIHAAIDDKKEKCMKVLASVVMLLLVSAAASAADVDGKWTGTSTSPQGDLPVTFTFKADGAKLTGSTLGFDGMEVQIKDGKITDKNISFT